MKNKRITAKEKWTEFVRELPWNISIYGRPPYTNLEILQKIVMSLVTVHILTGEVLVDGRI
jgi:hypothetical protein